MDTIIYLRWWIVNRLNPAVIPYLLCLAAFPCCCPLVPALLARVNHENSYEYPLRYHHHHQHQHHHHNDDADAAASLPMWGGASALCLMSGPQNEDDTYKKSIALQLHLMAWELPDTVMVSACCLPPLCRGERGEGQACLFPMGTCVRRCNVVHEMQTTWSVSFRIFRRGIRPLFTTTQRRMIWRRSLRHMLFLKRWGVGW